MVFKWFHNTGYDGQVHVYSMLSMQYTNQPNKELFEGGRKTTSLL